MKSCYCITVVKVWWGGVAGQCQGLRMTPRPLASWSLEKFATASNFGHSRRPILSTCTVKYVVPEPVDAKEIRSCWKLNDRVGNLWMQIPNHLMFHRISQNLHSLPPQHQMDWKTRPIGLKKDPRDDSLILGPVWSWYRTDLTVCFSFLLTSNLFVSNPIF